MTASAPSRLTRRRSATLNRPLALLVAGTFFMENLDGTIIATAAPAIAADLGVAPVDVNLAMTAYLVTIAVGIPISGWLTDRFGVSWQVVPKPLGAMLQDPDPVKAERVMHALMDMSKLDLAVLQASYDGRASDALSARVSH